MLNDFLASEISKKDDQIQSFHSTPHLYLISRREYGGIPVMHFKGATVGILESQKILFWKSLNSFLKNKNTDIDFFSSFHNFSTIQKLLNSLQERDVQLILIDGIVWNELKKSNKHLFMSIIEKFEYIPLYSGNETKNHSNFFN